jgi:hypothetical protein
VNRFAAAEIKADHRLSPCSGIHYMDSSSVRNFMKAQDVGIHSFTFVDKSSTLFPLA